MSAVPADADESAIVAPPEPQTSDKLKFACKTALGLTLAYMLPMALGWAQPQTAAITVMLIAATGSLSESLQKGALRTLGTIAGAAVGLSLIALFPQDRMLYLGAISVFVTVALYLYKAYQGDGTVFMLAIVVSLMVFNGGDAEGAFIYGVDRTLLTVFGVLIYSLVGSLLWPVKVSDNTQLLATAVSLTFSRVAKGLAGQHEKDGASQDTDILVELLKNLENFRSHFNAVRKDAPNVQAYLEEWTTIQGCYERLEAIALSAMRSTGTDSQQFDRYISNYDSVSENLGNMLSTLDYRWRGDSPGADVAPMPVIYNQDSLGSESHLVKAAVYSHGELLEEIQQILAALLSAVRSLRFDSGDFHPEFPPASSPSFIWFDRENLKTALRGFITFWLATWVWITFNPPGGFMFVTMCTALIPLVSYTPVTPKLLIFLFSFGFLFAIPAYVFLLPAMTHWLELALFLFSYAFIGFFMFAGPVAIFFLLGLFTLGIQNTMSYHFDVILIVTLMFYMVCALQIVSVHFPFTSKPERLYCDFRRRFFKLCAAILRADLPESALERKLSRYRLTTAAALLTKMNQWAGMIDQKLFPGSQPEKLSDFNQQCENLLGRLRTLTAPHKQFAQNKIIRNAREKNSRGLAALLCDTLATEDDLAIITQKFESLSADLVLMEEQLNTFLDKPDVQKQFPQTEDPDELAGFYAFVNVHASILQNIERCRQTMAGLDWPQLRETRF